MFYLEFFSFPSFCSFINPELRLQNAVYSIFLENNFIIFQQLKRITDRFSFYSFFFLIFSLPTLVPSPFVPPAMIESKCHSRQRETSRLLTTCGGGDYCGVCLVYLYLCYFSSPRKSHQFTVFLVLRDRGETSNREMTLTRSQLQ